MYKRHAVLLCIDFLFIQSLSHFYPHKLGCCATCELKQDAIFCIQTVHHQLFYKVLLSPSSNILYTTKCVSQSGELHPFVACEQLSLCISRMPLSYPIMILSPVTTEPAYLWNVPKGVFGGFHIYSRFSFFFFSPSFH